MYKDAIVIAGKVLCADCTTMSAPKSNADAGNSLLAVKWAPCASSTNTGIFFA